MTEADARRRIAHLGWAGNTGAEAQTLTGVIDAFRLAVAAPSGWHTPGGALNNCGDASLAFEGFCRAAGLSARKVAMIGLPDYVRDLWTREGGEGREPGAQDCHVVVTVGGLCVDWTRRQYQPGAAFPHVATRRQLEAEGWEF